MRRAAPRRIARCLFLAESDRPNYHPRTTTTPIGSTNGKSGIIGRGYPASDSRQIDRYGSRKAKLNKKNVTGGEGVEETRGEGGSLSVNPRPSLVEFETRTRRDPRPSPFRADVSSDMNFNVDQGAPLASC